MEADGSAESSKFEGAGEALAVLKGADGAVEEPQEAAPPGEGAHGVNGAGRKPSAAGGEEGECTGPEVRARGERAAGSSGVGGPGSRALGVGGTRAIRRKADEAIGEEVAEMKQAAPGPSKRGRPRRKEKLSGAPRRRPELLSAEFAALGAESASACAQAGCAARRGMRRALRAKRSSSRPRRRQSCRFCARIFCPSPVFEAEGVLAAEADRCAWTAPGLRGKISAR